MPANRVPARVARLLLGQRLRDLRASRGLCTADAATRTGIAWATVCRLEHGDVRCRCRPDDVLALGRLYQADVPATRVLEDLARVVRVRLASERQAERGDDLELVRDLEAYACRVRCYSPGLVPELLRTAEYAWAVLNGSSSLVAGERRRIMEVLRVRQNAMVARGEARFEFLLETAAVERVVGTRELMAGQGRRLLGAADVGQVTVRVLAVDQGVHCRLGVGGFTILDFPEDPRFGKLRTRVRVERSVGGVLLLDSPRDADGFEDIWREIAVRTRRPAPASSTRRRAACPTGWGGRPG